jgi:excisionase family DNA binding protein
VVDDDLVLTPSEAALLLRVPESIVRRMARDGRLAWLRAEVVA